MNTVADDTPVGNLGTGEPREVASAEPDLAAIEVAIRRRLDLSRWVELRAISPAGGKSANLWIGRGGDTASASAWAADRNRGGFGVYATFNAVDSPPAGYAKDAHVTGRSMVFIDIDPVKAAGVTASATDAERAAAAGVADAVAAELLARGWGGPFERHDTGNGQALYYLCEPGLDKPAVQSLIRSLAARHDAPGATLDPAVCNAARVARLPGTVNTKGDVRRLCRLLSRCGDPVTVTAAMVAEAGGVRPSPVPLPARVGGRGKADAERRAAAYLAAVDPAVSGEKGSNPTFWAARCAVYGFDLGVESGLRAMLASYNPRCSPPWTEAELRHKCEDADAKPCDKPRGWLLNESHSRDSPGAGGPGDTPEIVVTTAEHQVNDEAAAALAADPDLFRRAGGLVAVRVDAGNATIEAVPAPVVRDKLTRVARFVRLKSGGGGEPTRVPAHPPDWCVANVAARKDYPGVRPLDGAVGFPVLGPCGSVLAAGYHESARLFVAPGGVALQLPASPSRADACAAADRLADLVAEFPFKSRAHFSAWVAALLTPLARPAIDGPVPFTLIDANAPNAGKGKLANVLHRVLTGRDFPVTPFPREEREMDTRLTGFAHSGVRMVCFDNLAGKVGSANLDAAITGTSWAGRPLYSTVSPALTLPVAFFATGNNVRLHGDLARRTLHVRLEVAEEHPDGRDFRVDDIVGHAGARRAALLADALTILSAYCAAGRPRHGLPGWGSFEAWSALVREAVVFCGLPDPAETRAELRASSDRDADVMRAVLAGLREFDPEGRGVTAAQVARGTEADPGRWGEFRASLEEACEPRPVTPSRIGYAFRGFAGRNFGGLVLAQDGLSGGSARWVCREAAAPRQVGWWDGGIAPARAGFDAGGAPGYPGAPSPQVGWWDGGMPPARAGFTPPAPGSGVETTEFAFDDSPEACQ